MSVFEGRILDGAKIAEPHELSDFPRSAAIFLSLPGVRLHEISVFDSDGDFGEGYQETEKGGVKFTESFRTADQRKKARGVARLHHIQHVINNLRGLKVSNNMTDYEMHDQIHDEQSPAGLYIQR